MKFIYCYPQLEVIFNILSEIWFDLYTRIKFFFLQKFASELGQSTYRWVYALFYLLFNIVYYNNLIKLLMS